MQQPPVLIVPLSPPVHSPCLRQSHPEEADQNLPVPCILPSAAPAVCRMKSRLLSRSQAGLLPTSRTISCHFSVPPTVLTLAPSDNLQILLCVWSLLGRLGWAGLLARAWWGGGGSVSHNCRSQSRSCPEAPRKSKSGRHTYHMSLGPGAWRPELGEVLTQEGQRPLEVQARSWREEL